MEVEMASTRGHPIRQAAAAVFEAAKVKPLPTLRHQIIRADVQHLLANLTAVCNNPVEGRQVEQDRKLVEDEARITFHNLIAGHRLDQIRITEIWALLDITIVLEDDRLVEQGCTFSLLEELIESQTIDDCPPIFDYLESRRQRLVANDFPKKQLHLLRACNRLLKRLSRAEDTVFCGRIFFFLFQVYPLHEKSALNVRGFFNSQNQTVWDELPPTPPESPEDTTMQDAPASDVPDGKKEMGKDAREEQKDMKVGSLKSLYPQFWSLQKTFSAPDNLSDPQELKNFKAKLEETLRKFDKVKAELRTRGVTEDIKKSLKRKRGEDEVETSANGFDPKYLTSWDLFELEISDLAFRRHILVQALVILGYLQDQQDRMKQADATSQLKKPSTTFPSLSDEDGQWINKVTTRITNYLGGPEQSDQLYYRIVETVIARDKHWARWKREGCNQFEEPGVDVKIWTDSENTVREMFRARKVRPTPMGALDLEFLKSTHVNGAVAVAEEPNAPTMPSVDDYRSKILDDDFTIDMANDEEERTVAKSQKMSKTWRALRLASRTELHLFNQVEKLDDLEELSRAANPPDPPEDGSEEVAVVDESAEMTPHKLEPTAADESAEPGPPKPASVEADAPTESAAQQLESIEAEASLESVDRLSLPENGDAGNPDKVRK